jgi:hypothetical protein
LSPASAAFNSSRGQIQFLRTSPRIRRISPERLGEEPLPNRTSGEI